MSPQQTRRKNDSFPRSPLRLAVWLCESPSNTVEDEEKALEAVSPEAYVMGFSISEKFLNPNSCSIIPAKPSHQGSDSLLPTTGPLQSPHETSRHPRCDLGLSYLENITPDIPRAEVEIGQERPGGRNNAESARISGADPGARLGERETQGKVSSKARTCARPRRRRFHSKVARPFAGTKVFFLTLHVISNVFFSLRNKRSGTQLCISFFDLTSL